MEDKTLDRRTFTSAAVLAMLSGVAITISGCGGSSSPTTPTPTPTPTPAPAPTPTPAPAPADKNGSISSNHGHSATVTGAKQVAGVGFGLDIQGSSPHSHTVNLTNADIAAIAGNQRVSKESSDTGGHTHTVTFN